MSADLPDGAFGLVGDGMLLAVVAAGLGGSGVAVYAALARYADRDTRQCAPSVERIVERTGLNERTVRRVLRAGRDAGLWAVHERRHTRKGPRSSVYTLHDQHLADRRQAPDTTPGAPSEPRAEHRASRPVAPDTTPGGTGHHARWHRASCPVAPGVMPYEQSIEQSREQSTGQIPSASADGHARPAHAEPDDARAADVPAVRGDARPEVVGSTPGLDRRAAEAPSPSPVSPTAVVPHVDRARLRRDVGREGRIVSHAIDVLRQAGADTPASARGPILAVLRTHGDEEPDALADRLDVVLARLAGHDVEAAAS